MLRNNNIRIGVVVPWTRSDIFMVVDIAVPVELRWVKGKRKHW